MDVIQNQHSGSSGFLPLTAAIQHVVSLKIEDSPTEGSNLVSSSGINFGSVNSLGTTDEPGVKGTQIGNVGHYEARFSFTAISSTNGPITLECRRSSPGNFNPRDGVEIDDAHGSLEPLSALGFKGVTVLEHVAPGSYDKRIAINIHPTDKGVLQTILQFTLCAL